MVYRNFIEEQLKKELAFAPLNIGQYMAHRPNIWALEFTDGTKGYYAVDWENKTVKPTTLPNGQRRA